MYALMTLTIPDLLFARRNVVSDLDLPKSLAFGCLENENEAMRFVATKQSWNRSVTIPDALEKVEMRVVAEIAHHRAVSDFWNGAAYAH